MHWGVALFFFLLLTLFAIKKILDNLIDKFKYTANDKAFLFHR